LDIVKPQPDQIFKNDNVSLVRYDANKNVMVKKLLQRKTSTEWYDWYKDFQQRNTKYPRVEEIGDDYYCMEYIPNYGTVGQWIDDKTILQDVPFTKEHGIDLLKTLTTCWNDGLEFSKSLPDNKFWCHCDLEIWNVLVLEDFSFKVIDPDSWNIVNGYDTLDQGLNNVCREIGFNKIGKSNV
tara:strand:+ start:129 stop:674 length:546 start_codon:yes stop_codon:yes gene_type:complete